MRRIGLTFAALVSATALAACGSSSSGGGDDDNSSTQPTSSSAAGFDKTAATTTANAALMTLSDLPDGWTENPSDTSESDDEAVFGKLADCLGVDASIFEKEGPDKVHVESSDFQSPNDGAAGSVSESIDVETDSRIADDFEVVNSDKLPGCFESVYSDFLKQKFAEDPQTKAATIGDVTATRGDLPTFGDESTGISIKVPFSIAGTDAEVDIDVVFIRVGNIAAQLSFENTFKPFDTATAASITSKAVDKLKAAADAA